LETAERFDFLSDLGEVDMISRRIGFGLLLVVVLSSYVGISGTLAADEDKFPLRKKWPELKTISTEELAKAKANNEAIIVDTRTAAEINVLHIQGCHQIEAGDIVARDGELRALTREPHKYLVFYCNGTTCSKSYKAAEIAIQLGFQGVRVYDEGIFDWAHRYPEQSVFFGRKMTREDVDKFLVSEEDFEKGPWAVPTRQFVEMAKSKGFHTYDLREARERTEYPIALPNIQTLTLDRLVSLLELGTFPRTQVLMLDNVGKQVFWAKYYLDKYGVKDFYVLTGGVRQWRADGLDSKGEKLGKVYGRPKAK